MGRPMPSAIRQTLRATHHPARSAECPHCGAQPHRPCRSQSRTRLMPEPHPSRIAAWATTVAVCPACQVEPGVPCHVDGHQLQTTHPQRCDEARRTAA